MGPKTVLKVKTRQIAPATIRPSGNASPTENVLASPNVATESKIARTEVMKKSAVSKFSLILNKG